MTAAALAWVLKHWRTILHFGGYAALGLLVLIYRGDARHWHKVADGKDATIKAMQVAAAQQEAANTKRVADAAQAYADRAAALQPIIVHSKDTVREYAQSPAGRVDCLGADRVRGIEAFDRALSNPPTPAGSDGAMPDPVAH